MQDARVPTKKLGFFWYNYIFFYVLAAAWHIFRESLWEAKDMSEKKMTITEDHSNVIQIHWSKTLLESIWIIWSDHEDMTWFSTPLTCPTCFSYFGGHRIEIRSGEPEGSSRGIVAWRSDSCLQLGNPKWPKTLLILCCRCSVSHQPFHVYPGSQQIIVWNWQRRYWLFGVPQKQQISIFKVQLCWSRGSTRSLVQTRNTRSVIKRCFVAIGRWKISLEFYRVLGFKVSFIFSRSQSEN